MVSSSTLAASPSNKVMRDCMDELNVAHALLGVVPKEPKSPLQSATLDSYAGLESLAEQAQVRQVVTSSSVAGSVPSSPALPSSNGAVATGTNLAPEAARAGATAKSVSPRTGLDALAALALQRDTSTSVAPTEPPLRFDGVVSAVASSSDDDEAMPPPPPRRQRSVSNPEGMEKWDSLHRNRGRRHFVLPASILEEELAEASAAVREKQLMKRESPVESLPEEEEEESGESEEGEEVEEEEEEEVDESLLTPEELLRKARSRLLEDLSEGSINGEKGELMLPHALRKYKHVYNQNGRIGIYTPAERAAIIARFNAKRQRRVWNKKIRYNCRKSLADRRLRVKGRFVKRSEQEQLARELQARVEQEVADRAEANESKKKKDDADMPDVNDPEAGFAPTEDQPYRRLRRYTIT